MSYFISFRFNGEAKTVQRDDLEEELVTFTEAIELEYINRGTGLARGKLFNGGPISMTLPTELAECVHTYQTMELRLQWLPAPVMARAVAEEQAKLEGK